MLAIKVVIGEKVSYLTPVDLMVLTEIIAGPFVLDHMVFIFGLEHHSKQKNNTQ